MERRRVSESERREISEDDRWQEIKTLRFVSDSHSCSSTRPMVTFLNSLTSWFTTSCWLAGETSELKWIHPWPGLPQQTCRCVKGWKAQMINVSESRKHPDFHAAEVQSDGSTVTFPLNEFMTLQLEQFLQKPTHFSRSNHYFSTWIHETSNQLVSNHFCQTNFQLVSLPPLSLALARLLQKRTGSCCVSARHSNSNSASGDKQRFLFLKAYKAQILWNSCIVKWRSRGQSL